MNAVSANQHVAFLFGVVREARDDRMLVLLESDQPLVQLERVLGQHGSQMLVEIRTLDLEERGTKLLDTGFARGRPEQLTTATPVPGHVVPGLRTETRQPLAQAKGRQHVDGIGPQLDSGTDLTEYASLFEPAHLEAGALRCDGGDQSPKSGADDRNTRFAIHSSCAKLVGFREEAYRLFVMVHTLI